MAGFEHEVEIARPPGDVFAYLTDLANLPEWQGGIAEVHPEEEGELRVGSRFTEVRSLAGRRMESTIEVAALEPEREFSLRVVEGPVAGAVRHLLESTDGGTRLRVVGEVRGGGLRSLAGPLLERAGRRQARSDLERLKRVLESP